MDLARRRADLRPQCARTSRLVAVLVLSTLVLRVQDITALLGPVTMVLLVLDSMDLLVLDSVALRVLASTAPQVLDSAALQVRVSMDHPVLV